MSLMNGEESIKGGGEVAFDLAAAGAGVAPDKMPVAPAKDDAAERPSDSSPSSQSRAQAQPHLQPQQSQTQSQQHSQPQPQPQLQSQSHPAASSRYAARAAKREQKEAARRDRDEAFMRLAIEEARRAESLGEVPIGAVVVYEPIDPATRRPLAEARVIARACNLRETTQDPAGHAEFLALKQASEALGVWRLTGCTVYVTLEPCLMCAGLMQQSRVDRCVFGAADPKAGALGSLYQISEDVRLNHTFEVQPGVLADDCAALLRGFFAAKRKKRTEQNLS